jgi:hypothetical protein
MRYSLIIVICFLLSSCRANKTVKPLKKPPEAVTMISDDPTLTEEERNLIRTVEILLLIEELEANKTYRLETDEEYKQRTKERKRNGSNSSNQIIRRF